MAEFMGANALVEAIEGPRLSIPLAAIRRLDGDLAASAFLCQAAYLSSLSRDTEGWFDLRQVGDPDPSARGLFGQMGSWQALLGLAADAQGAVRKKLRDRGLLEEERRGIPARLHYRVQAKVYLAFLAGRLVKTPDSGFPGIKTPGKSESRLGKKQTQESGKSRDYPGDLPRDLSNTPTPHTPAPGAGDADPPGGGSEEGGDDDSDTQTLHGVEALDSLQAGLGAAILPRLANLPPGRAQALLDRLVGDMRAAAGTPHAIHHPGGLLRAWLAEGDYWCQSAAGAAVAQAREGEARRQAALGPQAPDGSGAAGERRQSGREAIRAAAAKIEAGYRLRT